MANKKQKRMEEPPEDKTNPGAGAGKPKPGVTIKVDGFDLGKMKVDVKFTEEQREKMMKQMNDAAERMARSYLDGAANLGSSFGGLFGGGERASGPPPGGGGNIFIEGGDGRFRSYYDRMEGDPSISGFMHNILGMGGEEEVDFESAVCHMLHKHAIECWDNLVNWQFAATHNVGQDTYWFTARYYDDEEASPIPLVSETLEFKGEVLSRRNWDETHLEVERQMERLHEKCMAEKAMFDD